MPAQKDPKLPPRPKPKLRWHNCTMLSSEDAQCPMCLEWVKAGVEHTCSGEREP